MSNENIVWSSLDDVSSDINTRLLPMLQLCKFASNAAQQLQEFRTHGEIYPEFKEGMQKATEYLNTPMPEEAHELVAGVLYMAESLALDIKERVERVMDQDRALRQAEQV